MQTTPSLHSLPPYTPSAYDELRTSNVKYVKQKARSNFLGLDRILSKSQQFKDIQGQQRKNSSRASDHDDHDDRNVTINLIPYQCHVHKVSNCECHSKPKSKTNGDDDDEDEDDDDDDDDDESNDNQAPNNNSNISDTVVGVPSKPNLHFSIRWQDLTYWRDESTWLDKLSNVTSAINRGSCQASANCSNKGATSKQRVLLDSLCGCFKSGQLSAILGPSGAGKSTFIECLFGRKQQTAFGRTQVVWSDPNVIDTTRQISDNKAAAYDNDNLSSTNNSNKKKKKKKKLLKRHLSIAIVPQEDQLLNHLTVYESLMFASQIKNSTSSMFSWRSKKKKNKKAGELNVAVDHELNVQHAIAQLHLKECAHTRCGSLSGGQYKRVSIAQELLSNPDVIVLDEPTSGLDALTCYETIKTLKQIIHNKPIAIILTIHQPDTDVFYSFDHVYVIAQGGVAIYDGKPREMAAYLTQVGLKIPPDYNPARFIVENSFRSMRKSSTLDGEATHNSDDGDKGDEEKKEEERERLMMDKLTALNRLSQLHRLKYSQQFTATTITTTGSTTSSSIELAKPTQSERLETDSESNSNNNNPSADCNQKQQQQQQTEFDAPHRLLLTGAKQQQQVVNKQNNNNNDNPQQQQQMSSNDDYTTIDGRQSASSYPMSVDVDSGHSDEDTLHNSTVLIVNDAHYEDGCHNSMPSTGAASSGRGVSPTLSSACTPIAMLMSNKEKSLLSSLSSAASTSGSSACTYQHVRDFDKRLSAKYICSKRRYNTLYHAYKLTQRTWLSISRDPVFCGLQFVLHFFIPLTLAGIFGSDQDEACPVPGEVDLIEFAYTDHGGISQFVRSIRNSLANVGIVYFEMFVVCFAVDCITALVFPIEMRCLVKEYRNSWYNKSSYYIARTLAELPLPLILHTMAIGIIYYMTGQPRSPYEWRFIVIVVLVQLSSFIAQSYGLATGALLMNSSKSAVLLAAGTVAPMFALSGFIVRIDSLSPITQVLAQCISYLYHLLNGFIILRYGFGRCPCNETDFNSPPAHAIPNSIRSAASLWIGTYSNEYLDDDALQRYSNERNYTTTNVDPNIDLVDKMTNALKLAQTYGHELTSCDDMVPYAMLDFHLRDHDLLHCFVALIAMAIVSRCITFITISWRLSDRV